MILGKKEIEKRLTFDYKEFHDDELDEKQIYIKVPDETIADGIESFKKMYIGNDSIDLHISDKFFKMNSKLKYINTLSFDPDECFEEVKFDIYNGYTLKPGEIIFIGTIEQIQLKGNIIGRVVGRSTFARLGLSIHCTQEKFSTGINSIVPLQIVNHAPVPLKIFPKQKLVQLIIEEQQESNPYSGSYKDEIKLKPPILKDSEYEMYDDTYIARIKSIKGKEKKIDFQNNPDAKITLFQYIIDIILITAAGIIGVNKIGLTIFCVVLDVLCHYILDYAQAKIKEETKNDSKS